MSDAQRARITGKLVDAFVKLIRAEMDAVTRKPTSPAKLAALKRARAALAAKRAKRKKGRRS